MGHTISIVCDSSASKIGAAHPGVINRRDTPAAAPVAPSRRDNELKYIDNYERQTLNYETLFDDREWLGSLFITLPTFYWLALKVFGSTLHSVFWLLLLTQVWVPI